jgi:hypothetical protein
MAGYWYWDVHATRVSDGQEVIFTEDFNDYPLRTYEDATYMVDSLARDGGFSWISAHARIGERHE